MSVTNGISSKNKKDKLTNDNLIYGVNRTNKTLYMNETGASSNRLTDDDWSMLRKNGLLNKKYIDNRMYSMYSKFGYNDPYNRMQNTKAVLFFTKPDLHIMSTDDGKRGQLAGVFASVPFFEHLLDNYPNVIKELQSGYGTETKTMCLLHNRVKDTLDLPDLTSQDIDMSSNMHGNNYEYRGSSEASDDGFTFTLEFEDTKNLDVYMLFKAYDEYERYKRLGRCRPLKKYTENKVLHDQIAIYKFTLADDMMTIIHWAKLWGCYPTSVPRSVFGNGDFSSSGLSLSISWKSAFIMDMDPFILQEFNELMLGSESPSKHTHMNTVDTHTGRINRVWADSAFVSVENVTSGSDKKVYRLRWFNNN